LDLPITGVYRNDKRSRTSREPIKLLAHSQQLIQPFQLMTSLVVTLFLPLSTAYRWQILSHFHRGTDHPQPVLQSPQPTNAGTESDIMVFHF